MKRAALAATLAALAIPATAQASYYLNRTAATHLARDYLHNQRGYNHTVAACRPQGLNAPDARFDYHRWVCGFVIYSGNITECKGQVLILGSTRSGDYYYARLLFRQGPYC